ncbi:hypothetical protein ACQ4PT_047311 [Festuca glaucescens]
MKGSEETALLDPKTSPLLLFHYNYYTPVEESDDQENFSDQDEPEEDEQDDNASYKEYDVDKSDSDDALVADEEEAEKTYCDDDGDLFLYSVSTGQLQGMRLDDLESHFYWVTPQGWLLMRHHDTRQTFLWNPFTSRRISLPSAQGEFLEKNTTRCLLSHAPTDPNCIVLVVNFMDTVLWYCSPVAGTQWVEHRYDSRRLHGSRNNVVRRMRHLAASGGKFYTDMACAFVTLQFSPHPTFTVTPFGVKSLELYSCTDFILLESCGELFKLSFAQQFYVHKVLHIRVEKLDIAERAWVKVQTLGDRVFLVNYRFFAASFGAEEVGLKRNCIYFLKRGDKGLYVYNMERGTTTVHNPGKDLQDDVAAEILFIPLS